jgi:hypothetical protein
VIKHATILATTALLSFVLAANADATPRRGQHQGRTIECNERGCSDHAVRARVATDANGSVMQSRVVAATDGTVIGRRPAGCPHAFCGCEASLYLFGHIRTELNRATNWMKFPRTSPAPGMVAVRNHHVMVLMNQVDGKNWRVHDGNSGGGLTREHVRSINGYMIVNPRGA